MKNLRFNLIHRRNISDKKTGLELTHPYKIQFISLNWMEDYTLEYCCFSNTEVVKQVWSPKVIFEMPYIGLVSNSQKNTKENYFTGKKNF